MSADGGGSRGNTWPANRPAEDVEGWERFADSDRAAGFEISENFRRFSQRDDIFCRARWDDGVHSKQSMAFFDSYRIEAIPRRGEGFNQRDFALRNASWTIADDYADRNMHRGMREGFLDPLEPSAPPAPERVPVDDPAAAAADVKRAARLFGADLVGITEYDPRWVYTDRMDAATTEEKPNDLPEGLVSAIVMGHGMDYELAEVKAQATMLRVFVDRCIELHLEKELDAVDAAMAKLLSTDMMCDLLDECLQLFGGYGYMWEYPIARAWADARMARIAGGTSEIMKEIIGRSVTGSRN